MDDDAPAPRAPWADPIAAAELLAFVVGVEGGSLHAAAEALDLTQSAVTKRLARLERRLGVRLLERSSAGVRPSAAGRVVHPLARRALAALDAVEAAAGAHRAGAAAELRLAASHTVGEYLLPDWLPRFASDRPGVHFEVEVVNSPGVLQALRDGRADVGFVEGVQEPEDVVSRVVAHDEIVVVVGAGHRWAGRRSVAPRELSTEPYVTREQGSGTRAVVERALAARGIALEPTLETGSTQAVKRAVAGRGFSLLSALAVQAEVAAGTHAAVLVRDVDLARELRAWHLAARPPEGAARAWWDWLGAR